MHLSKKNSLIIITFIFSYLLPNVAHGQYSSYKIDSLKKLVENAKPNLNKIKNLIALSDATDCDDTANKISYAKQALALATSIKLEKEKIDANMKLGQIYFFCIKKYLLSITYFEKALSVASASKDSIDCALSLTSIGGVYRNLSQHSISLDYYKKALLLNAGIDIEIGILGNMGTIYTTLGDNPRALASYDSSLKLLDKLIRDSKENRDMYEQQMVALLITIGDIYFTMSEYDKALENYNHALMLNEKIKNKLGAIWALTSIGKTYQYKKDAVQAIAYYNKALDISKEINDTKGEAIILNQLGGVYLQNGEVDKAITYSQRALQPAEENNYNDLLPAIYTTLGKIYTAQKKYKEAVGYLQKAIAICVKTGSLVDEKDAWEALSNTYKQMKQPGLALDAFERFIGIRDSVYNISKANELTRIDLQSGYERKQIADSVKQAGTYGLKMQQQRVYTYTGYAAFVIVLLVSFFIYRGYSQQKRANVAISKAHNAVKKEKQVSENLLLNILPEEVAKELKTAGVVQAKLFDHVTVLFTDFVNFTEAAEHYTPQELVAELHTCFKAFDGIIGKYDIEKIKTVGDAYLAVSGLPNANAAHAREILKAGLEIRDFMIARKQQLGDKTFGVRIGVNSGTVVAGIVGVKKFAYDIWGDTVNVAARMEQYSDPGRINISQTTYDLVKNDFVFIDRGELDAKHKGKMRMYFVDGMKRLS